MAIETPSAARQITRRAALGGAVAMAAWPALAEECRIGPPPHAKGPLVDLALPSGPSERPGTMVLSFDPVCRESNAGDQACR
jgi:hypothetical protein